MKRVFLLSFLMLTFSVCMFSQAEYDPVQQEEIPAIIVDSHPFVVDIPETDIAIPAKTLDGIFETFLALVAFIPIAVQFLRKLIIPNAGGIGAQIFSWAIGIAITLAGWFFNLGFLSGLSIWLALLYGACACLAANGIFDTKIISGIFGLFKKPQTI